MCLDCEEPYIVCIHGLDGLDDEPVDMVSAGMEINRNIANNFPGVDRPTQQVLNLAEEVGEFVGEFRRYAGLARRNGNFNDMSAELADVIIAAYVAGAVLNIQLDQVINDKLKVIFTRGWKEVIVK